MENSWTHWSFPDKERNCYALKPTQFKNDNYLIRAFFAYGNYDGQNKTSVFNLGVNYWETVGQNTEYKYLEIIHAPLTSSDTIHDCFVNSAQRNILHFRSGIVASKQSYLSTVIQYQITATLWNTIWCLWLYIAPS